MTENAPSNKSVETTRRDFLQRSTATLAAASVAPGLSAVAGVYASGSDTIRIGLIGCGGRGSGAAAQAMKAEQNCKLVAMGDLFRDRLEASRANLSPLGGDQFDVKDECCFVGFDAYKQVIDSGVDVVLLATPPPFRPEHLRAAVEAGKHVFAEKPVAVDAPGIRSVLASSQQAKKKNLSLVSGLCWRYHNGLRETIKRVHDGAVGEIVALQANYDRTGCAGVVPREPGMSDMEWQIRNYPHFLWTSGDYILDALVHQLDVISWAMKGQYPIRAVGTGGRQTNTMPEFCTLFDHHAVCYEFANGVRCYAYCKMQAGTVGAYSAHVFGAKGTATLMTHAHVITGETNWKYREPRDGPKDNMFQQEHDELFASIRAGKPINNGEYMAQSTLMAIMGRMATYTGQEITWEQALSSSQVVTPPAYEFGPVPVPPVPVPGVTRFS